MKDLGWTAFFALLVCVIAVFYLGKEKDGSAVLVQDEYMDMGSPEVADPSGSASTKMQAVDEENLDFYAKPPARNSARASSRESQPYTVSSEGSTRIYTKKAAKKENEYKTAKASTGFAVTAATTAKQEAAKRLNEKAIAAEKKLISEKKRSSSSFISSEKKLKEALKKEDLRTANKAAEEMEEELGVNTKFTASKPGEKLPENPLTRKRH